MKMHHPDATFTALDAKLSPGSGPRATAGHAGLRRVQTLENIVL